MCVVLHSVVRSRRKRGPSVNGRRRESRGHKDIETGPCEVGGENRGRKSAAPGSLLDHLPVLEGDDEPRVGEVRLAGDGGLEERLLVFRRGDRLGLIEFAVGVKVHIEPVRLSDDALERLGGLEHGDGEACAHAQDLLARRGRAEVREERGAVERRLVLALRVPLARREEAARGLGVPRLGERLGARVRHGGDAPGRGHGHERPRRRRRARRRGHRRERECRQGRERRRVRRHRLAKNRAREARRARRGGEVSGGRVHWEGPGHSGGGGSGGGAALLGRAPRLCARGLELGQGQVRGRALEARLARRLGRRHGEEGHGALADGDVELVDVVVRVRGRHR
jgi:hypothetical protein